MSNLARAIVAAAMTFVDIAGVGTDDKDAAVIKTAESF